MKKDRKRTKYDYSRYGTKHGICISDLEELEFWGFHKKKGRLGIDTKRYLKACNLVNNNKYLPEGLFDQRNTVYYKPTKIKRHDYSINIFRDLINSLKTDWFNEYKEVFKMIKTPKQVIDEDRSNNIAFTSSSSEDYDDINVNATIKGMKRMSKYIKVINSLYFQFIMKITSEIDRVTLLVLNKNGYDDKRFDMSNFIEYSEGLNYQTKIEELKNYNKYDLLRKMNNFLKHNSLSSYESLKNNYPNSLNNRKYENGMYSGNYLIIEGGFIDNIFDELIIFFEQYSKLFLKEDLERSKWDYEEYFYEAYKTMRVDYQY